MTNGIHHWARPVRPSHAAAGRTKIAIARCSGERLGDATAGVAGASGESLGSMTAFSWVGKRGTVNPDESRNAVACGQIGGYRRGQTGPGRGGLGPARAPNAFSGRQGAGRAHPLEGRGYCNEKRTGTATQTATGLLFESAGLNTHCMTAAFATSSSIGMDFTTFTSFTLPSLPTRACTITTPSTPASRAMSG